MNKFQVASSADLKKLLLDKLPEILAPKQKENKIRNMLQKMKRNSLIKLNENREWQLV
ncbi:hypothetical protein, partial [Saprospira grandis]|uniref:Transcriptional regulator n=1 Tax=Saprospira grandis (strain Lewin) TaxID=984262 RepID=H6L3U6_SAPGL